MAIPNPYPTILAGTDFSPLSMEALAAAADLATLLGADRLHVVHALPQAEVVGTPVLSAPLHHSSIAHIMEHARAEAHARLGAIALHAYPARVTREVLIGAPVPTLLRAATELEAALIVIATHGRPAVARMFFGSVASGLVRTASCPVFVVRGGGTAAPMRRVLAAIDFSPVSGDVLEHAATFALKAGATLDVVSIREVPIAVDAAGSALVLRDLQLFSADDHRLAMEDALRAARIPPEVQVERTVLSGRPTPEILRRAKETRADLIVVGTSGHNLFQRALLGSTATKLLAHAPTPVLAVPVRAG